MPLAPLPPTTVKLIGSSQVITSVSSVIKELMENSIDAGAQHIEIKLEKHGLEKIEVKDDGSGITKGDATIMCLPNYTSKILEFSDLDELMSYGFRGEALSSLCNVAQVSITTKTAEDEVASSYTYDRNGQVVCSKISPTAKGTIVTVTELFKNLPVRKQFVSNSKRAAEELKRVEKVVKSLGMVHPRLRVTLIHNKFLIWQKTSVPNLRQSVMQVINLNIVKQLHHILHSSDQIRVEMLVPKRDGDISSMCFSNFTDAYFLFINNRPIRCKEVEKAVYNKLFEFFGVYVPANKYPVCVTCLTLPPGSLDVNLEPNKTRVYIKNQDEVLDFINQCLHIYYGEGKREEDEILNVVKPCKKRKLEEEKQVDPRKVNSEHCSDNITIEGNFKCIEEVVKCPISASPLCGSQSSSQSISLSDDSSLKQDSDSTVNSVDCIFEEFCLEREKTLSSVPVKSDNNPKVPPDVETKLDCDMVTSKTHSEYFPDLVDEVSSRNMIKNNIISNNCIQPVTKNIPTDNALVLDQLSNKLNNYSKIEIKNNENTNSKQMCGRQEKNINICLRENQSTMDAFLLNSSVSIDIKDETNNDKHTNLKNMEGTESELSVQKEQSINFEPEEELNRCASSPTLSQWSKGAVVGPSGVKVQGHRLLERRPEPDSPSTSQELTNRSVSSQMGCKEMSAFTKFARKMRKEILEEKPDLSFTKVAQTLQAQWRNLDLDERKKYEEAIKIKTSPVSTQSSKQKTLSEFLKSTPNIEIEINMDKIGKMVTESIEENEEEDICLIGQLEASSLWFYRLQGSVFTFSMSRCKEAVQFHQYMADFALPSKQLSENIRLTSCDLRPQEWELLLSLERSPNGVVKDERFTKNGFLIEILEGDVEAHLSYVPQNIAYCGVEEVQEILSALLTHGLSAALSQCRPLKVVSFIRSEAMRDCNREDLPSRADQVSELLSYWINHVSTQTEICIHYRPITKCLYSL